MLINKNTNSSLDIEVKNLKTLKEKTMGIMFSAKPKAVYLETRFGIHTFFVNFPIDLIILDKQNVAKVVKENLKPYRLFLWNPQYFKVLELPCGTIDRLKISLGNILSFNLL